MGSESGWTWEEVEGLLHQALERPREEVEAFLAKACDGRPGLKQEVKSLVEAYCAPPEILERSYLTSLEENQGFLEAGHEIGPYRIRDVLGRGGMGVVYLAERVEAEFSQKVALKIVESPSPSLVKRLTGEMRILAALSHPHIAQFLDGGLTTDGMPYLAMEYVPGRDILSDCDARRATVDERLGLFETICSAVAAAHQNLVVHRDLKPSNILVTPDGVIKLLDFGIAKLLQDDPLESEGSITSTGPRFLSLECAAPEVLEGRPSGTPADVFSLGVLLYRLISGHRPHEIQGVPVYEMVRRIHEDEVVPPSKRNLDTEISSARGTTPARLRRELRGDLDTITLTALRGDVGSRYSSLQELLEDVRSYRRSMPIRARGSSWWYRSRRAVRRHWLAASTTFLVVGSLVVGTVSSLQGRRAAEREARKAELVSELLLDLFDLSSPNESSGQSIDARELLDTGVRRVEERFADQPELQVELFRVLGEAYTRLGFLEEARRQLERSVDLGGLEPGQEVTRRMQLLLELAELERLAVRFDQAERYYEQVLEIAASSGSRARVASDAHNGLGLILETQGRFEEAVDRFELVLDTLATLEPTNDIRLEMARTQSNLALVHSSAGDLKLAKPLLLESIGTFREVLGPVSMEVASAMTNLAYLLRLAGELEEAEPYYRGALEIRQDVYGGAHPEVAQALNNLGAYWYYRGDLEKADAFQTEAFEMWRSTVDEGHPDLATALLNLSVLRSRRGKHGEAVAGFRQALEWLRRTLPPDHPEIAHGWLQLARSRSSLGETQEAVDDARGAVAMFERTLGAAHGRTRRARAALVSILVTNGECHEAAVEFETLAVDETDGDATHRTIVRARDSLERCPPSAG